MILDKYFKQPLLWDYIICSTLSGGAYYLYYVDRLILPPIQDSISITTDATTISLTIAGFILTLLTVLITFKSGSKIKKLEVDSTDTIFDLFFASGYYFETVKHLKNSIKSLLFIAVLGFGIKLFLPQECKPFAFFFNILGLGIIILTIWRCVLILGKILDFQKQSDEQNN